MKEILCWLQTSDGYLFLLTERELHVRDSTTHCGNYNNRLNPHQNNATAPYIHTLP